MLVSTVYGRYRYIADVLGGLLDDCFGFWLGHRLARARRVSRRPPRGEIVSGRKRPAKCRRYAR